MTNHIISITGWGSYTEADLAEMRSWAKTPEEAERVVVDSKTGKSLLGEQYWIARNSWGEYWGELGFFRIHMGDNQAAIEEECAWATPDVWTDDNFPCEED